MFIFLHGHMLVSKNVLANGPVYYMLVCVWKFKCPCWWNTPGSTGWT